MKRTAKALVALAPCALWAALSLASAGARADDLSGVVVVRGGGEISFAGAATTNWVGGDFVIVYTNTASAGSFTLPGATKARILAVGGGGGGGGAYKYAAANDGGGGGGGAGGVLETNDIFQAGNFSVSVGAGGGAGAWVSPRTKVTHGTNGVETVVYCGDATMMLALGGGGGGGATNGLDGASGGGGSMMYVSSSSGTACAGGKSLGQGYPGGAGDRDRYGGGGGGAGGAGADASSTTFGLGGAGVQNDITGSMQYYGGGGGGGCAMSGVKEPAEGILGGSGVGGRGGVGSAVKAEAGKDGTGSGGGGASRGAVGGKGGDGVVIVRIDTAISGGLDKPKDKVVRHTGEPQTSISETAFYTVRGTNTATEVGVYFAQVKPIAGIKWTDGTDDEVTVRLIITPADSFDGTAYVTGAPISFKGASETNWVDGDLLIKFAGAGTYDLPGTTKARVLAVGGGGGGGGAYKYAAANDGGGGGGGAGGVLETNDVFTAGNFVVSVGAGGGVGAWVSPRTKVTHGTNGVDTVVYCGDATMMRALGGGGGGGASDGLDGASGGGGSMLYVSSSSGTACAGGKSLGQGYPGGAGDRDRYGGGGGGAGGAGADASNDTFGLGGAGVQNDITGSMQYYGGGGGGGCAVSGAKDPAEGILGGSGVGGRGGVGSAVKAEAGKDGTGSGGGGASRGAVGGKGGDGVVYVRISGAMVGELNKPEQPAPVTYDGQAHTAIVESVFYDLSGDANIVTNVGSYTVTATLKGGMRWSDGTKDPVTVTLTINKCPVTLSVSQESWIYRPTGVKAEPIPDPTVTATPTWVKPIVEYATKGGSDWSTARPALAGDYTIRSRIPDEDNLSGAPATADFSIARRTVTFENLLQKDWMFETPETETPRPSCDFTPNWLEPIYEYAKCAADVDPASLPEEQWGYERPSELGEYAIRIRAPDEANYDYKAQYSHFKIYQGRGGTFVDYVDFTVPGTGTDEELTNFPYRVTLSEKTPYGFLYSRAGTDGSELAFADTNNVILAYAVYSWNTKGESAVYVQIPYVVREPQTVRLYWMLREGATTPDHRPDHVFDDWDRPSADAKGLKAPVFDLVTRQGYRVNYFKTNPSLSPTVWNEGTAGGTVVDGVLAEGTYTKLFINSVTGETSTSMPTKGGAYRLSYVLDNAKSVYEDLEYHVDFAIQASYPVDDLKGASDDRTAEGRILIANDEAAEGHEITGQSYWHTNAAPNSCFWVHSGTQNTSGYLPNVRKFAGCDHTLYHIDAAGRTNTLWTLKSVLLGNPANNTTLEATKCFLPWSPTGLAISWEDPEKTKMGDRFEAGQLFFRNSTQAAIYSPLYTNGIGTIYFDGVNLFKTPSEIAPESVHIVVEYSTETVEDPEFVSNWKPCTMRPLQSSSAGLVSLEETQEFEFNITKGGTADNFYRFIVPLDIRGNVRFRIRRTTVQLNADPDYYKTFLVLDNILVSYPKNAVALKPYGSYDATKDGKRVLGQEAAFSVPFPAVGQTEVYGRATNDVFLSGMTNVSTKGFAQLARMHYRWTYLNQDSNKWDSVDLSPFDGYCASKPLEIPDAEGDIEFFYEIFTALPFYQYYDYSGSNKGLGGLYSEETGTITNRVNTKDYAHWYGSSTNSWFVRLRAGKSDWDEIQVRVQGAYASTTPMELIGNHTWRGLVRVPSNATGTVTFSFNGIKMYEEWGTRLVASDRWWRPVTDVAKLPGRGETTTSGATEHGYPADGASGFISFEFNDESGLYTIGHAEYQAFNAWHDAKREDGKFVGSYAETSGVSVTEMITTNAHMNTWNVYQETDSNWNEPFEMTSYDDPGFPKYTAKYIDHKMPRTWMGVSGKFVDAHLTASNALEKAKNSGMAWQMEGSGDGSVSYTESTGPSGLGTLSFKARLAQSIGFSDFSVWDGEGSSSLTNYTFVFPAVLSKLTKYGTEKPTDYSPGATMSVVGYHRPGRGCYEFRIELVSKDGLQFSIYRWAGTGDGIASELLGTQWFSSAEFQKVPSSQEKPDLYAMFISVGEETVDGKVVTSVIGGLSKTTAQPSATYSGLKYRTICCLDSSDKRLKKGGFGGTMANCTGLLLGPRHWSSRILKTNADKWSKISGTIKTEHPLFYSWSAETGISYAGSQTLDNPKLYGEAEEWVYPDGRLEMVQYRYSNLDIHYGVAPPSDISQDVEIYVKPRSASGGADWTKIKDITVKSYGFPETATTFTINTNADLSVKFQTGSKRSDVTIWQIGQTQWNGQDIEGIDGLARDFVYTQGKVKEETSQGAEGVVTNRYLTLHPAGAEQNVALSVRSPLLDGLGMITFSYKDLHKGCEVWVQVATNAVAANLTGSLGYNRSVKSVELGEPNPVPTWITLRRYSYDELKLASKQNYYIGWHTHEYAPVRGVIRLFIPTNVVHDAANKVLTDATYGSITITDVAVQDEPAIDTRSWLGWNLRMVGDATDSERRMLLPDLAVGDQGGLSAALNNSLNDIVGDKSAYDKVNPTIQSPTFGRYAVGSVTNQAKIGEVRFRARLYETNATAAAKQEGHVWVYGVMDGSSEDWGEPLTNFVITGRSYRQFTYRSPARRNFASLRLVIDGVIDGSRKDLPRVLFDEIVVTEKSDSNIGFRYARPFRDGIGNDKVIANILDKDQQPLIEESWGVQAQLRLDQFGDDIDVERGVKVYFRYYIGKSPWGYDNWHDSPTASAPVELQQVGAKANWIFRSTASDPLTVVPSQMKANTVVQYMLYVTFYQKGNNELLESYLPVTTDEGLGWTNPDWYAPIDLNRIDGTISSQAFKDSTSPYTILDGLSPGRAWINEVNYNDGPKQQNGGLESVTNQFIELAVPWGVDMKGWRVVLTDYNQKEVTLAELGVNGVPTSKKSGNRSGDYDFMVLVSPATKEVGGVTDSVTGKKVMDGAWVNTSLPSTFSYGTLKLGQPYQLSLYRPSGILEHQYVIAGTNEWRETPEYYASFGYKYDGTNLLAELDLLDPNPKRFYAGDDLARSETRPSMFSSFGVAGGAHGEEGGWSADMAFTPGRVNEGQDKLENWYIRPNGGFIWIYATVKGDHISQRIGDDESPETLAVINSGHSTSIVYTTAAPWYGIGALTVNGVTNTTAQGQTGVWALNLNNVTETTYVVAEEGLSPMLLEAGLDPADRYTPAVMNWLLKGEANGKPFENPEGPISFAQFRGLKEYDSATNLSVKLMYWLDIDPTAPGWWVRGDMTDVEGREVVRRQRLPGGDYLVLTNREVEITLYLSNEVSRTVYAPYRLQGLGNEQSDSFTGTWTSETFQVTAYLNNGLEHNLGFLPLRWFMFGKASSPSPTKPYSSRIELLDPFSTASPGYNYGWSKWRGTGFFFKWSLNEDNPGQTPERHAFGMDSLYDEIYETVPSP